MTAASPLVDRLPLARADLDSFERCGISRETLEAAGVFRVDCSEGARIVGRRAGAQDYSGIVFPYYRPGDAHPREYRLRLDNPPLEVGRDGSLKQKNKYLSAPGTRAMLYFPPRCAPEWMQDASLPLVIVEGEKKTLALHELAWYGAPDSAERPRWLPIGIAGVWNWRGQTGIVTGPDGERRPMKGAIPDLDLIGWKGRRTVILFDANVRTNPQIQAARWELTRELRRRGARVHWWRWPQNAPTEVNGVDDLIGLWGRERVLEHWDSCIHEAPASLTDCERFFERIDEDRFRLDLPAAGVTLEVDRLKWSGGELHGELMVRCDLPGVRAYDGVVAVARLNLSSLAARRTFTKELQARAGIEGFDWSLLLEELAQRTLAAQRNSVEVVVLDEAPLPNAKDIFINLDGFRLLRHHPNLVFSPGGGAKSYLALHWATRLSLAGERTLYLDTEADIATHRLRLHRLVGASRGFNILYHRAAQPLAEEVDGLRRLIADRRITFVIVDSVSCAIDGPLEESATATRLFQVLRRFSCGSLLLAHTQKGVLPKDRTAYGSVFFTNLSRRVWSAEKIDDSGDTFVVKLKCVKSNFGPAGELFCYRVVFEGKDDEQGARTDIFPINPADIEGAAQDLPLHERIAILLRRGSMTRDEICAELDIKPETVRRTINRYKDRFIVLNGGRVGLKTRVGEDE